MDKDRYGLWMDAFNNALGPTASIIFDADRECYVITVEVQHGIKRFLFDLNFEVIGADSAPHSLFHNRRN